MRHCGFRLLVAAAAMTAVLSALSGQTKTPYVGPHTADGKPDLQGMWQVNNAAAFDVTEVAEGHEIPYLPQALEKEQKGDRVDPIAHCFMPGVPRITYMPFPIQILQRPGKVVFMYEYLHDQRIVPTTPRP